MRKLIFASTFLCLSQMSFATELNESNIKTYCDQYSKRAEVSEYSTFNNMVPVLEVSLENGFQGLSTIKIGIDCTSKKLVGEYTMQDIWDEIDPISEAFDAEKSISASSKAMTITLENQNALMRDINNDWVGVKDAYKSLTISIPSDFFEKFDKPIRINSITKVSDGVNKNDIYSMIASTEYSMIQNSLILNQETVCVYFECSEEISNAMESSSEMLSSKLNLALVDARIYATAFTKAKAIKAKYNGSNSYGGKLPYHDIVIASNPNDFSFSNFLEYLK